MIWILVPPGTVPYGTLHSVSLGPPRRLPGKLQASQEEFAVFSTLILLSHLRILDVVIIRVADPRSFNSYPDTKNT